MNNLSFNTILKLAVYSIIVGAVMYYLNISPGSILSTVTNALSGVWNWLKNSGFEYMLLGATIVIPLYLLSEWKKKRDRS